MNESAQIAVSPQSGQVAWPELLSGFGRIGLLSFGGPAGQIAVMHRILVDEKRWLSERQFLHALNFCMLLPGPEAMQLATYAGWLLRGTAGGVVAGLLFILPGLAMMLVLAAIYVGHGDVPAIEAALFGLKAAVLAIVLQALLRVSRKAVGSAAMAAIAVAAFVAIAFLQVPFPLIILFAALAGIAFDRLVPQWLPAPPAAGEEAGRTRHAGNWRRQLGVAIFFLALWLVPLAGLMAVGGFAGDAAQFFSKTAVVTFGGAYAVLAYVAQQAVETMGWLTAPQMLEGLGLAETTLGPLVLVLVFVGFLAGAGDGGSIAAGIAGGLLAAWFTFMPCFFWIFAGAPHVERMRHMRWLAAALSAITAAVVGVIANLAVWFAINVLFAGSRTLETGALKVLVPLPETLDMAAAVIAVLSGLLAWRGAGTLTILSAAMVAGLVFRLAM